MADHDANEEPGAAEAQPPLRRVRHRRSAVPKRACLIAGGVALIALLVLAAVLWLNRPTVEGPNAVTVQGVEYVTNVEVAAQGGYVYVYLPVNSDVDSVVLEVADAADNRQIREFLDDLDTLVPGEHVLSLSETNLHFIVDGIDEADGGDGGDR